MPIRSKAVFLHRIPLMPFLMLQQRPALFLLLMLLLGLMACDAGKIVDKTLTISPDNGWTYPDSLEVAFTVQDTSVLYNLFLTVNHTTDFGYQNLYTRIRTGFPDGEQQTQVLSLELADKAGGWEGKCTGKRCQLEIPLQENAIFSMPGTYTFSIAQFMRQDSLPGVKSIRFRVEKSETER